MDWNPGSEDWASHKNTLRSPLLKLYIPAAGKCTIQG